ncbi:MAG: hypothetical protein JKY12_02725 [Sneathiella sp.]|nr:hypothetical protein [Sneathiella sp.]
MKVKSIILASAAFATLSVFSAQAAETIKIAFVDPLSGPFASTGSSGLQQFRYAVDELVNKKGGVLVAECLKLSLMTIK